MDGNGLAALLAQQSGVACRRQLHELGYRPHDIQRLLRRRQLARIHPGVYLEHTGGPTWQQRAWAGVLALWPAALCHESALHDEPGPGDPRPIHVAVARGRNLVAPDGVRLHQLRGLQQRVLWNRGPPRLRYDDAVVDVAARARSDLDALGVLTEACRTRRTTPRRLAGTVVGQPSLPRRAWLLAMLGDLAAGTASVLEHAYLTGVERRHGLPRGRRQVRVVTAAGVVYRDVDYADGVLVELDGRLHGSVAQRDADLDRDLHAAVGGLTTVRLSWGQVVGRPCATATALATLLHHHGWTGRARPCSSSCAVGAGRSALR